MILLDLSTDVRPSPCDLCPLWPEEAAAQLARAAIAGREAYWCGGCQRRLYHFLRSRQTSRRWEMS